jgi:hypothetical protein
LTDGTLDNSYRPRRPFSAYDLTGRTAFVTGAPGLLRYGASQAAVVQLAKTLAAEVTPTACGSALSRPAGSVRP